MAPPGWGTPDQKDFIEKWMPEFIQKKDSKSLSDFWPKMEEAWFDEFPEEEALGLPVQTINEDPNAEAPCKLTDEETASLQQALTARKSVRDSL